MRWSRRILLAVLAFEAIGALVGGPLLVASPDGRLMEMPVAAMHGVFADFLVPGILLTLLGLLNAAAFFVLLLRRPSGWLWAALALGGFLIWFLVELAVVGAKVWAQAAWGIPVVVGIIAMLPEARRAQFVRRCLHLRASRTG
jgi:hypothetical protein